jgi:hypothetical protein
MSHQNTLIRHQAFQHPSKPHCLRDSLLKSFLTGLFEGCFGDGGFVDDLEEGAFGRDDHEIWEHGGEGLVEQTFVVGGCDWDVDKVVFSL